MYACVYAHVHYVCNWVDVYIKNNHWASMAQGPSWVLAQVVEPALDTQGQLPRHVVCLCTRGKVAMWRQMLETE